LRPSTQATSLRIALTADPELPVPPVHYGGIERIVDMLARALTARGHRVTLFAHPQSQTQGTLIPWPGRSSVSRVDTLRNAATLMRSVLTERFDLVHSFSRVAYLTPILPLPIPKLMTYQRDISPRPVRLGHALSLGSLHFSALSRRMMKDVQGIGSWHLVFNGVPLSIYDYRADPGPNAPLVFLGRIEKVKGPHIAIEVARKTNLHLIIAGNVPEEHRAWFDSNIAPSIDGKQIIYCGPVDDIQKNELLGRAKALLMPILWEEPFGIVMAEAMACGTPVIGLSRGAVPEVVEHGVTGFVVHDVDGIVSSVARLSEIDRFACRSRVVRMFSDQSVVEAYLDVYREMLEERLGHSSR
jgi:glycosyltransferase involved in cell wall biosynthesis